MNTKQITSIVLSTSVVCSAAMLLASTAQAVPTLQLDIKEGTYDQATQTIKATTSTFTLCALLTPQQGSSQADIDALLADTYYISAALTPKLALSDTFNLGTFSIDNSIINATNTTLRYGAPPLHDIDGGISDTGDLQSHGIFDTFYTEIAFNFDRNQTAKEYNTQDYPGGLVADASGASYYEEFSIDTSALATPYAVHFDLYETQTEYEDIYSVEKTCMEWDKKSKCTKWQTTRVLTGQQVVDVDVNKFAPYSHDAQSTPVPEPATMLLFGTGLVGLAGALRRRKRT